MAVAEVEPDRVRLERHVAEEPGAAPSGRVTYASCQGLTLHNRVCLDRSRATSRCVGALRRSSELLEAAEPNGQHLAAAHQLR